MLNLTLGVPSIPNGNAIINIIIKNINLAASH